MQLFNEITGNTSMEVLLLRLPCGVWFNLVTRQCVEKKSRNMNELEITGLMLCYSIF